MREKRVICLGIRLTKVGLVTVLSIWWDSESPRRQTSGVLEVLERFKWEDPPWCGGTIPWTVSQTQATVSLSPLLWGADVVPQAQAAKPGDAPCNHDAPTVMPPMSSFWLVHLKLGMTSPSLPTGKNSNAAVGCYRPMVSGFHSGPDSTEVRTQQELQFPLCRRTANLEKN